MEGLTEQLFAFGFGLLLVVASAYAGALFGYKKTAKIEKRSFRNKLRMAALNKRLDKHQEAYALWHRLFHNVNDADEVSRWITQGHVWWVDNCLYMSEEARDFFALAISTAALYRDTQQGAAKTGINVSNDLKELWNEIGSCGPILEKSVGLPPKNDTKKLNWENLPLKQ